MTTSVMDPAVETAPAAPNVVDDLKAARGVLVEVGWCQGTYAQNAEGRAVDPTLKGAHSFCALGALASLGKPDLRAEPDRWTPLYWLLSNAVLDTTNGEYSDISRFNDTRGRTKDEVIALFDRAIALAEANAVEVGR